MLKGISPLLSPRLLATLSRMGHGDEIVLADAHFPGSSFGKLVLRADGTPIAPLLDAARRDARGLRADLVVFDERPRDLGVDP